MAIIVRMQATMVSMVVQWRRSMLPADPVDFRPSGSIASAMGVRAHHSEAFAPSESSAADLLGALQTLELTGQPKRASGEDGGFREVASV